MQSQQNSSKPRPVRRASQEFAGQKIFAANCSACHGLDGKGSERGPNIVSRPEVQRLSPAELNSIVSTGIPGTGMPAFEQLGKPALSSLVAYLKTLQGKGAHEQLPGNPANGKSVFFGAANCSSCHMVAGQGGFFGPELTTYGQTHTADEIQTAITNSASRESRRNAVTVTTQGGERYEGMVRNEDNFSLQMQSADGAFHLFSKADLKSVDHPQDSLMHKDYASRLTATQLKDIASFLLDVAEKAPVKEPSKGKQESE